MYEVDCSDGQVATKSIPSVPLYPNIQKQRAPHNEPNSLVWVKSIAGLV